MPSNFSLRTMNGAHRFVIAITGGRFGWFMAGMPMLELTTTGRKSGEKRSTMLSSPLRIHGSYVVVASRGGDDVHPAWFLNLRDDPHVEVVIQGGPREPRIARIASAEERERLWPQITSKYPNYGGYQEKTAREIPIVFLEPV
jgi:deazaflavin-dependent oxidoreductase (nitroreductase family)